MTRAADTLSDVLTRQSSDYRATVRYYGNIEGRPGFSQVPRRLLSDIGFPANTQFSYVVPAASHIIVGDAPRVCTRVTLHPYGLARDARRLRSTDRAARLVQPYSARAHGVRVCPLDNRYVVPADIDDATVSDAKNIQLVRQIVGPTLGPTYHVIITRAGDVLVAGALDDTTQASGDNADISIDVAMEGAVANLLTDHEAGVHSRLIELPYTLAQINACAALFAKVQSAFPAIPGTLVSPSSADPGIAHQVPEVSGLSPMNFTSGAWRGSSPFDHQDSDAPGFFLFVSAIGTFDLSTEVYRTDTQASPRAGRVMAQGAVQEADTAGERSLLLGDYAAVASVERANDMQGQPRRQMFTDRILVAHRDAGQLGEQAGAAADASPAPLQPAQNTSPHTFDFVTGYWRDGHSY